MPTKSKIRFILNLRGAIYPSAQNGKKKWSPSYIFPDVNNAIYRDGKESHMVKMDEQRICGLFSLSGLSSHNMKMELLTVFYLHQLQSHSHISMHI